MGISLFLDFVILSAISFILLKKRLHTVEYLFIFFFMVFLFSIFVTIIVDNLQLWTVSEKPFYIATFRIAELIFFPILPLWFVDFFYRVKRRRYQILVIGIFLCIPIVSHKWLTTIHIIDFKEWKTLYTIQIWFIIYLLTLICHRFINYFLQKEGITKNVTSS
ncbi:hypothetical protein LCL95_13420 [Bacillus timonensis]|nr:hypothetical protein [Bacillus timonensis]